MFERFNDQARRVVVVAANEAREMGHHLIEEDHLLLGVIEGKGVAAKVLTSLIVSPEVLRLQVRRSGRFRRLA